MSYELEELRRRADEVDVRRLITHVYSEQEKHEKSMRVVANMTQIDKHKSYLKSYKKENIDPLEGENSLLSAQVHEGKEERWMNVQGITDRVAGVMEYFSEDGELVDSRPLTAEERDSLNFSGR